jgi:hypothetical protein
MADTSNSQPVHLVAAEERVHPAYQRLARALIALARIKLADAQSDGVTGDEGKTADAREAGQ